MGKFWYRDSIREMRRQELRDSYEVREDEDIMLTLYGFIYLHPLLLWRQDVFGHENL